MANFILPCVRMWGGDREKVANAYPRTPQHKFSSLLARGSGDSEQLPPRLHHPHVTPSKAMRCATRKSFSHTRSYSNIPTHPPHTHIALRTRARAYIVNTTTPNTQCQGIHYDVP